MKERLRICYIGDTSSPHLEFWAQSFTKLGHEVHVISPHDTKIKNVTVHPTKTKHNKYLNFFLTPIRIKKIIAKIDPDIVHAHFLGKYTFLATLARFRPFVGTVWGSDIDLFAERNKLTRMMFKHILKNSDLISVADKTTAEFLNKRYGASKDKLDFPYWGINIKNFNSQKKKKIADVLYLRKSSPKYATEVFIEAMSIVKEKFPKVKFTLIRDPNYMRVENKIKEYGLEKNAITLRWVPHNEVPKLLNSCVVYVDSFYRKTPGGGLGITAMEAMASALPVILADNPGVEDYVKNNDTGLVYTGGNSEELAKSIIKLLEGKGLRERLGKNARKTALEELNWEKKAKFMENKYIQLAGKYKR